MDGKSYSVSHFMTKNPQRIAADARLREAHKVIQGTHARHLPVVDDNRLVGLVSLAGLYFAEREGKGHERTVREAMESAVTVSPTTPLEKVAELMVRSKVGAVVVLDAGQIAGLFTTVDALNALSWLAGPAERRVLYDGIKAATIESVPKQGGGGKR